METEAGKNDVYFIISAPRTGSTLLFEFLINQPGVYSIGTEGHSIFEGPFHPRKNPNLTNEWDARHIIPSKQLEQVRSRFEASCYSLTSSRLYTLYKKFSSIRILRRIFLTTIKINSTLVKDTSHKVIVDKTVKNVWRLNQLLQLYPQAKFIFIYRDFEETVDAVIRGWNIKENGVNRVLFRRREYRFSQSGYLMKDLPLVVENRDISIFGVPNISGVFTIKEFAEIQVKRTYELMDLFLKCHREKVLVINFGDMISKQEEELGRITSFLGLDSDYRFANLNNINRS